MGFSYDKSTEKTPLNDRAFAFENLKALFSFYNKFPELKDQELYLTGEQYAGITIPILADMIVEHNRDPYVPIWTRINLKGFLLENPCTLAEECDSHFEYSKFQVEFLRNHYFLTKEKYEHYWSRCALRTEECELILAEIQANFIKTGSDITSIYRECIQQTGPEKYKCMDTIGILAFLNSKLVREDLHVIEVEPDLNWDLCNLDVMEKFVRDHDGSLKVYEKLLREQHDLRIVIVT